MLGRVGRLPSSQLLLEPFLGLVVGEEEHLADADAGAALNVLLGARVVLVPHVHDCGGLAAVGLRTVEAIKVFLN